MGIIEPMKLPRLPSWPTHPRWRVVGLVSLALVVGLVLALVAYSAIALSRFERVETRRATYVYAGAQPLVPGLQVRRVDLAGTLARLKYVESRSAPAEPGQYRRAGNAWDIHLRGGSGVAAQRVRIEVHDERITRVTRDGNDIGAATLEPEILASADDRPGEEHRPVRLADTPLVLLNAVLAAEDHRFFDHGALDVRGMLRAAWTNLRAGRVMQGGSTITQQLIKNRLLGARRTYARKLSEAWLATLIEWRYSKQQILESYLNEIYLGSRSGLAVRGVGAAARVYFRKEIHQITPAEAALLAGMVRAPNSYSPAVNPERARGRRDVVLARMRELGMLSAADFEAAKAQPVRVPPPSIAAQPAPYFNDYVRIELEQRFGDIGESVGGSGSTRHSTWPCSASPRGRWCAASTGWRRACRALRRDEPSRRLQAALVALDPVHRRDPRPGRAAATTRRASSTARRWRAASRARPSSRSSTWRRCARGAASGRLSPPPRSWTTRRITLTRGPRRLEPAQLRRPLRGPGDRAPRARAVAQRRHRPVAESVGLPAVIETARALGLGSPLAPVPVARSRHLRGRRRSSWHARTSPLANGGLRPTRP